MQQEILSGIFVTVVCLLFIISSGCTSIPEGTPVPATQTPSATETQTALVTQTPTLPTGFEVAGSELIRPSYQASDQDAALDQLFKKSAEVIVNKTELVIQAMAPGTTSAQLVYSPSMLYLKAEDLGFWTERFYDQLLTMKGIAPENEEKRIAYLRFLYPAKNAAYHLADAAEAESLGDYPTALEMAILAKKDLQTIEDLQALEYLYDIEADPERPPTTAYNTLDVFLNDYIGRMRDKVIGKELNERDGLGSRFPRLT